MLDDAQLVTACDEGVARGTIVQVFGGKNTGYLDSAEHAFTVGTTETLGFFAADSVKIGNKRSGANGVVLGNHLYLVGGGDDSDSYPDVQVSELN